MNDRKQVAVVTGASRGIGRAIARRLGQAGYEVWAVARAARGVEELAEELGKEGVRVHPVVADMEHAEQVLAACGTILAGGEVPSVLVNNAGVALSSPLAKTRLEDYARLMAVNATAPFLLCRELMPQMAKGGGGRVLNIASTAALKGFKYTAGYCASKHALLGLTRALAVEYAGKNVTVNAVCPGWTDTDMLAASAENISQATGRTHDEARDTLAKLNPMGRLIRPEEVAELCAFLVSDAAAAVTGATYTMDAGETI